VDNVPASRRRVLVDGHLAATQHQVVGPGAERSGAVHRPPSPVLSAAHGRFRAAAEIPVGEVSLSVFPKTRAGRVSTAGT